MNKNILIVDDEPEIADLVALYLENDGYTVHKFHHPKDALQCIRSQSLDLAILDIMMPEITGFQLCQEIRKSHTYPVIMLTAKSEELDKITGLTLGADDYITKPFLPLELAARVKAQLRRYTRYNTGYQPESTSFHIKGLTLDEQTHECSLNGRILTLTPTEFSILLILCQNHGKVVSAESLFAHIWSDEYYTKNNNTITVHIRHLREKMGDSFDNPRYIKTVWGCGYKIDAES